MSGAPDAPLKIDDASTRGFVRDARLVFALTLLSRLLGLGRDALCSRVFATSAVFSAFVTAFTVPNLFRRLFGEGALTAAFIPAYTQLSERDEALAARFASLTVALVVVLLSVLTLLGEAGLILLVASMGWSEAPRAFIFAIVMLPYMPLVCLVAVLGAMLQTHGRFAPHAASPVVLNVCMIGAVATSAYALDASPETSALWISFGVLAAGVLQLGWCALALRRHIRWRRTFEGCGAPVRAMGSRLFPALIGLGTLQVSAFLDSLIAGWPVLQSSDAPVVPWTSIAYPVDAAGASVLFYAQRLYQFPLGVFGIAIATAVFPMLSRHAGRADAFASTLRHGVRLSLFIGVPASVGLLLVRTDLTGVIYGGGAFGSASIDRVSWSLAAYAPAVWAYSLTHVLTRAFYACGDTRTPMRVGVAVVCVNLAMNVVLIWPLAEAGLAAATALGAVAQCLLLWRLAGRRLEGASAALDGSTLRAAGWILLASAAMGVVVWGVQAAWPSVDGSWTGRMVRLVALVGVGGVVFVGLARAMKRPELGWLLERGVGSGR